MIAIFSLTYFFLPETRVIRTNRDEWLVQDSTQDHEKHRNKIVFILLKALSFTYSEEAVYLFKTLLDDQYIAYYPIGNNLIIPLMLFCVEY